MKIVTITLKISVNHCPFCGFEKEEEMPVDACYEKQTFKLSK